MTGERDLFGREVAPQAAARVGRKVFLSQAARKLAEEMRRAGASVASIAEALGVCETTARSRLGVELDRGLPGGRRPGRPRWRPSEADRAQVRALAAQGLTVPEIAAALGVSRPTLNRYCASELATGRERRALGLAETAERGPGG